MEVDGLPGPPIVSDAADREAIGAACREQYVQKHVTTDWEAHVAAGHVLSFVPKKGGRGKMSLTWKTEDGADVMEDAGEGSVRQVPAKFRLGVVAPTRCIVLGPTGNVVCEDRTPAQAEIPDIWAQKGTADEPHKGGRYMLTMDGYDEVSGDKGRGGPYGLNAATDFLARELPRAYASYICDNETRREDYLRENSGYALLGKEELHRFIAAGFLRNSHSKFEPPGPGQQGYVRFDHSLYFKPFASGMTDQDRQRRAEMNQKFFAAEWDVHGLLAEICEMHGPGTQLNEVKVYDEANQRLFGTERARIYLETLRAGTVCSVVGFMDGYYINPVDKKPIALWQIERVQVLYKPAAYSDADVAKGGGVVDVNAILMARRQPEKRAFDDSAVEECDEPPSKRKKGGRASKRRVVPDEMDDDEMLAAC
jgi:hypothetical protein